MKCPVSLKNMILHVFVCSPVFIEDGSLFDVRPGCSRFQVFASGSEYISVEVSFDKLADIVTNTRLEI